jgi:succinate dehydrogenase/fumarate reductase cytochrome b subunit
MIAAIFLSRRQPVTLSERWARQLALLSIAAPPIFTATGVALAMAGDPVPDIVPWTVFWIGAAAATFAFDKPVQPAQPRAPRSYALRVAHGISAVAILSIFLLAHIANHLLGLIGPDWHAAAMKALRHLYRARLVETPLVLLLFFQVASGLRLALRRSATSTDGFETFQIGSGVYLLFFILGHMNSVFIFARGYQGIETDWAFATGAPVGMIFDAWNIRLVPHYLFGVFFALSHLAAGARIVLLSHGVRRERADAAMILCTALSLVIAVSIILAMCGLRLRFDA